MLSAQAALERLRAGNQRFVTGNQQLPAATDETRRNELTEGQAPFAIVLGCADSRVPVEIVFDQGLGDIFTVRVAGNIATAAEMGSIEYAAAHVGSRLIVVLGHSGCGAVAATLAEIDKPSEDLSPNIGAIVNQIAPTISKLPAQDTQDATMNQAMRANVVATVERLRTGSAILAKLIEDDGLLVVGGAYDLATGKVDFFEGV